jgi:hypothetical protein
MDGAIPSVGCSRSRTTADVAEDGLLFAAFSSDIKYNISRCVCRSMVIYTHYNTFTYSILNKSIHLYSNIYTYTYLIDVGTVHTAIIIQGTPPWDVETREEDLSISS